MSENVFILGAGASYHAKAPLMSNFLDKAEDVRRKNKGCEWISNFELVFDVIDELNSVYAKSTIDLDNIETLFGIIEMAAVIRKLGDRSPEEINMVRQALINVIVHTLEECVEFPFGDKGIEATSEYQQLVGLIEDLGRDNCSVITFNYDISLDYAFARKNIRINYCVDENGTGFKLLKLHGSINWPINSDRITPTDLIRLAMNGNVRDFADEPNVINLPISQILKRQGFIEPPLIVPPTWNKNQYHGQLTDVWNAAANELSNARNIFVIGYSLPDSDSFFKYLLALGTLGRSRIRRFWVFDPDYNKVVRKRYESLIGTGITNKFLFKDVKFNECIDYIVNLLGEIHSEYEDRMIPSKHRR